MRLSDRKPTILSVKLTCCLILTTSGPVGSIHHRHLLLSIGTGIKSPDQGEARRGSISILLPASFASNSPGK